MESGLAGRECGEGARVLKGIGRGARGSAKPLIMAALAMLGASLPSPARSDTAGESDATPSFEFHGFGSQGFIFTLQNDFLATDSTEGSFEFAEIGLNVTRRLTETLEFGAQLFAQDLGPTGNFAPRVDWFYIDYRWRDWLALRAGRLKIPYGLYNEVHDVDAARVPVLLPGSVYPAQGREILFSHTGVELNGFARSSTLGALDYRVFAGSVYWDANALIPPGSPVELDLRVRYVIGGRLIWEPPLDGLRLGGSVEALRAEPTAYVAGLMAPISIENQSLLWVASAEYRAADLVLTAEYSRWHTRQTSDTPDLSPTIDGTSERGYAMLSYRLGPWFEPGVYYSLLFPDTDVRDGAANVQHDLAMTLRFDVNEHWLVKAEGHYMYGTASLNNPLLVGPANIGAEPHWAAFFLKSTAYF
jgi:hypothetical protein